MITKEEQLSVLLFFAETYSCDYSPANDDKITDAYNNWTNAIHALQLAGVSVSSSLKTRIARAVLVKYLNLV